MNAPPHEGSRRIVMVCDCGRVATGFAAARCGRDRRRNIRTSCPTRTWIVEYIKPFDSHGYIEPDDLRDRGSS